MGCQVTTQRTAIGKWIFTRPTFVWFSPVGLWVLIWELRLLLLANALWHSWHLNGLSPVRKVERWLAEQEHRLCCKEYELLKIIYSTRTCVRFRGTRCVRNHAESPSNYSNLLPNPCNAQCINVFILTAISLFIDRNMHEQSFAWSRKSRLTNGHQHKNNESK